MKVKLFLWGHLSSKQCLVSLSFSTQLLASERLKAFSHFGCDWIGTRDCFSHDGGVAQGTAVLVRWSTAPVQTGIPRQLFDWWPWDSVQTLSVLEEWMCLTLAPHTTNTTGYLLDGFMVLKGWIQLTLLIRWSVTHVTPIKEKRHFLVFLHTLLNHNRELQKEWCCREEGGDC